jgi:NAD(P)H-dependent flavin oxidoreductase YrpB (nitropropane dioxygenase family)
MSLKPMIAATAIAIGISGMAGIVATPAHAQDAAEAEIIGFHQLCQKGDRKACVRFGILIGRNEQRHADWRRAHADWWWWEH